MRSNAWIHNASRYLTLLVIAYNTTKASLDHSAQRLDDVREQIKEDVKAIIDRNTASSQGMLDVQISRIQESMIAVVEGANERLGNRILGELKAGSPGEEILDKACCNFQHHAIRSHIYCLTCYRTCISYGSTW